jgi:CHAT domain-containing protein
MALPVLIFRALPHIRPPRGVAVAVAVPLLACLAACGPQGNAPPAVAGAQSLARAGQNEAVPARAPVDIDELMASAAPERQRRDTLVIEADRQPPPDATPAQLATFYFDRGLAAEELGRSDQWLADEKRALAAADASHGETDRILSRLVSAESGIGTSAEAIAYATRWVAEAKTKGMTAVAHAQLAGLYALGGDIGAATGEFDLAHRLVGEMKGVDTLTMTAVEGPILDAECQSAFALGRTQKDIESLCHAALVARTTLVNRYDDWSYKGKFPLTSYQRARINDLRVLSLVVGIRNPLEAEGYARTALRESLSVVGPQASMTAACLTAVAQTLSYQGRFADTTALAQKAVDIYRKIGADMAGRQQVRAQLNLARAEFGQRHWVEAASHYRAVAAAVRPDDGYSRSLMDLDPNRAAVFLLVGTPDEGMAAVQDLQKRMPSQKGGRISDFDLEAQALEAWALSRQGHPGDAETLFKAVMGELLKRAVSYPGDGTVFGMGSLRRHLLAEAYVSLLILRHDKASLDESFTVADAVRAQGVQRALIGAVSRNAATDPEMADLLRRQQDASAQIAAIGGLLVDLQNAPASARDPARLQALRDRQAAYRQTREAATGELEAKFPDYRTLTHPPAATLDSVKAKLRSGEAMAAFLIGETQSFVWAVSGDGRIEARALPITRPALERDIERLRQSLDPAADTLGDIPPFDVALAHHVYQALLAPVEGIWRPTGALVEIPDGPLGGLPLALLPTAAVTVKPDDSLMFAGYRAVPWLVRKEAISQYPSASAFLLLRAIEMKATDRQPFIGFGDPWFTAEQATSAETQPPASASDGAGGLAVRGLSLHRRGTVTPGTTGDSVASLPRLPDTAPEVQEVGRALGARPDQDIFLGRRATLAAVEDGDLASRRVVMFATHGLLPGDIDGLSEPALALSGAAVAGQAGGDGLLSMSRVMRLHLNADWVVLSACNSGSANESGAEAVSGLGRAFFHAGSRALLVTGWPVESSSARFITTGLFTLQGAHPEMTRAQALQAAMVAAIDKGGLSKDGVIQFSYAHPLFWAPFSLIGDGG